MFKKLLLSGLLSFLLLNIPLSTFSKENEERIDSAKSIPSFLVPITCQTPTNLTTIALSNNSVALNWIDPNNPITPLYEISFGSAGFTPGNGTQYISSNNPDTIIGLSSGTTYDVYVRAICNVGDTSLWTNASTFQIMYSIPFIQDFQGFPNGPITSTDGWTNTRANIPNWTTASFTPSFATGPTGDHTLGNGLFVYLETSGGALGMRDTLSSSSIYVENFQNSIYLSYWYHMAGGSMGEMQVWIESNGVWDSITTYTGTQQLNQNDPWLVGSHSLMNYTGQSIRLQFIGIRGTSFTGDLAIDDVIVSDFPICYPPTSLNSTNPTFTTIDIDWTENSLATNWIIEYGPKGFNPGTGNIINTSVKPYTLSGLNPNTYYDFYVTSNCGTGNTSSPSSIGSFTTLNAIPYYQNFEGFQITQTIFSEGWTNTRLNGDPDWTSASSTPSVGTGPTQDHTTGNGVFLYLETSGGNAGLRDTLSSAEIFVDLSQNSIYLSYWYHMAGTTMGDMQVWVESNGIWDSIITYSGSQHINQNDPWLVKSHALPNYAGQSIRLKFIGIKGSSFESDLAIDDIIVSDSPICYPPTLLSSSNVSFNSIDLDWIENSLATNWIIEYGPKGFSPGTGTSINTSVKPYTLTGLNSNSEYDFYVSSICGIGNPSNTSLVGSFSTLYGIPYMQDFEGFANGTGITDEDWSNISTSNPQWISGVNTPSAGTGPVVDHTIGAGGRFLFLETSVPSTIGLRDTLNSTEIFFDASDTSVNFSFWYHMAGATMGSLEVWIESNGIWDSITTKSGTQQLNQSDTWLVSSHILTSYAGQSIRLNFIGTAGSSFTGDMAIDDVVINDIPSCFPPSGLIGTNPSLTSIDLDWTENNTANNWDIEYGPVGFTPGTGTIVNANSKPYTLNGLNPNTTYDFYVVSKCGPGSSSGLSGVGSFDTQNTIPYFQDFEDFNLGSNINYKEWYNRAASNPQWIVGTTTPSANTGPTADHSVGAGGQFVFLETSVPSSLGLRDTIFSAPVHISITQMAIDLNFWYHMHGATMGILEVWVMDSTGTLDSVGKITGQQQANQNDAWLKQNFLLTGYQGKVIQVLFIGIAGSSFTSDIAIDDVELVIPPADNIGISNIITPVSSCGNPLTDSVKVEITNYGSASQTGFNVGFSLDGVAIAPETITATLGIGSKMIYTFSTRANLSTSGIYNLAAYTLLTNDTVNENDSSFANIRQLSRVNTFPYSESFEAGPSDWIVTGNSSWELGTPSNAIIDTASNGTQAWVTDLDADYANNEDGAINSPCFDFSNIADPNIAFDIWWNAETSWDGAVLQSSLDQGNTWQIVGAINDSVNWYNDNSIDALGDNGIENSEQGWTGVPGSGGWLRAQHYLTGLGGLSNVQLRIAFASDGNITNEGIAFDNVEIFNRAIPDPYYPIGIINTEDANGVVDSLNVRCSTSGTVVGIDLDGNQGLSFYIIDMSTGVQEGINIFSFLDVSNYVVNEGDSIMAYGTVIQFAGLTELSVDSIRILSTGNAIPTPIPFNILNESTEARYIELAGNYVLLDSNGFGNYNMLASNGVDTISVRVDIDTDVNDSLNVYNVFAGDTICDLKGIGGQFDNMLPATTGYQIYVMRYSDLNICKLLTGIENHHTNSFELSISPNPTTGQFVIYANGLSEANSLIEIRDINGRLILSKLEKPSNRNSQYLINLSNEPKGVYMISIKNGNALMQEKLILY